MTTPRKTRRPPGAWFVQRDPLLGRPAPGEAWGHPHGEGQRVATGGPGNGPPGSARQVAGQGMAGAGPEALLTPSPPPPTGPPVWATAGGVVALPQVDPSRPAAFSLAAVSWRERASVVLRPAQEDVPLLAVTLLDHDHPNRLLPPHNSELSEQWIPTWRFAGGVTVRLLCPLTPDPREAPGAGILVQGGEGMGLQVSLCWGLTERVVFRPRAAPGPHEGFWCPWTQSWRLEGPGVGLALKAGSETQGHLARQGDDLLLTVRLSLHHGHTWLPLGLGENSEAASLAAMHLARLGGETLLGITRRELARLAPPAQDGPAAAARRHALFGRLFTSAFCYDRDEEVLLTSRSPRYYVSGAYWSRDACWWTLPATTRQCAATARRHLQLALTRYGRHAPRHALWLDGQVLYDGFELDQLCYPLLAVADFARHTGDETLWAEPWVRDYAARFLQEINGHKSPQTVFYKTFLNSSDDILPGGISLMANVLVVNTLMAIRQNLEWPTPDPVGLRRALLKRFTLTGPGGPVLGHRLHHGKPVAGDNPTLSLLLLPFLGFLPARHPLMRRTAAFVTGPRNPFHAAGPFRGEGCEHGGGAWTLGLASRLLSGLDAPHARRVLLQAPLDGGDACEAIDSQTGQCHSGAAMASAAAFITQGLLRQPAAGVRP